MIKEGTDLMVLETVHDTAHPKAAYILESQNWFIGTVDI
jgi:methionine synthase I (cobalamin-dependent)